jgi:hypothetical protein
VNAALITQRVQKVISLKMGRHCANCDAISSITCSIQRKAAAVGKAQIDGHILNSIFMQILQLPSLFQRVSVSYSGMCLPASVMSHICHLFQTHPTPLKKKESSK